ncbi:hypothetical protein C8R47DRAFT_1068975 [Mycena vitilis]|nr:hypothetical protein C8R47DRAFT_1248982 [Mycena vitilis]KAJ6498084.1 hypothetical protein C8R47DRAFT_1068975 [Mycena vitilis]
MSTTPQVSKEGVIQHPIYWQEETRHMVLQVENTTYFLSLGMLTMVSPELKGIFDIPQSPPKPGEAPEGTRENPVFIDGVTKVQFDDFLGWILKPGWRPEVVNNNRQEEVAVNLLLLGQKWNVREAIAYAKEALEKLKLLAPRQIQLARMFSLDDWVPAAVATLLDTPFETLTADQFHQLSPRVVVILAKAKEVKVKYRHTVAHLIPKLRKDPDHDCLTHARCHGVWKEAWWRHVPRQLTHPTNEMPIADLPDFVRGLTIEGMSWSCQYDAMSNWVSQEPGILEAAVEGVLDYHRSLL